MKKTCGNFELNVYTDGYPITIDIKKHLNSSIYGEIRFTHKEIRDMKYLIDIAERECKNILSDKANKPTKDLHPEFIKSDTWTGFLWWWNKQEVFNPINRKAFVQKMKLITSPKPKFDDNITHCMGSFY